MRAIYHQFDNHRPGETLLITGDAAHHLNVVRIRSGESILLLNGKGNILSGEVTAVTKNSVTINLTDAKTYNHQHELSLAVALPKKDAFEDILKMSVELGIQAIYPLSSDFSQYEYETNERVQRILESALIQSNNPFLPVIYPQCKLENFLSQHAETIVFFNSQKNDSGRPAVNQRKKTILIGPEGGFSPAEVAMISKYSQLEEIHLPTPILRAPTAVASSVGYLLARENDPK